ncbi:peptidoglycan DD-metalloendopeptidase family protein [Streptomyces sp. NPDC001056]
MRRLVWCGALRAAPVVALALLAFGHLAWADASPARSGPGPGPAPGPGSAGVPAVARVWPVGVRPPVLRSWRPPATPYGPGHRGADLGAATGTPVRTVAAGRVSFAGRVAGEGVVTVELTGTDLRTTYEPVSPSVQKGDAVGAGEVIGVVERAGAHCGAASCVHWGLLRGETYLNPLALLPPWLLDRGPSRLLPVLTG